MRHQLRVFCDARLADGLCFLVDRGRSGGVVVLVELGLVEQRHVAVLEVLDGVPVTEVAARAGVTRQTVHRWLTRYAARGLAGLVDQSKAPGSCPHQMAPVVEARIVAMRVEHPGWGPVTIGHWLEREGVSLELPGFRGHGVVTDQAARAAA